MDMDQERSVGITEDIVRSELLDLKDVFLKLRDQIQRGKGALGKIDVEIEEEGDPGEILALDVFDQYKESLVKNEAIEIKEYFFGNEKGYRDMVKTLSDPFRLRVLQGFYNIDEETSWRNASDAICSRQSWKDEGFPRMDTVEEVLKKVNKKANYIQEN